MSDLLRATTGAILVQIVPSGEPGLVYLVTTNVGRVELTKQEMAHTLRQAAEQLDPWR